MILRGECISLAFFHIILLIEPRSKMYILLMVWALLTKFFKGICRNSASIISHSNLHKAFNHEPLHLNSSKCLHSNSKCVKKL